MTGRKHEVGPLHMEIGWEQQSWRKCRGLNRMARGGGIGATLALCLLLACGSVRADAAAAPTPTHVRIKVLSKDANGNPIETEVELGGPQANAIRGEVERRRMLLKKEIEKSGGGAAASATATPAAQATRQPVAKVSQATPIPTPTQARLAGADRGSTASLAKAESLFQEAQERFRKRDLPGGRAKLAEIFRGEPKSVWAGEGHVALARQFESEGNWREAVRHAQDPTVQLTPENRRALAALAGAEGAIGLRNYALAGKFAEGANLPGADARTKSRAEILRRRLKVLGQPLESLRFDRVLVHDGESSDNLTLGKPATEGGEGVVFRPTPGRVLWLEFWRPDCPYCTKALGQSTVLESRWRPEGVQLVWVRVAGVDGRKVSDLGETAKEAVDRDLRRGLILLDRGGRESFDRVAGSGTPWTVLVDAEGVVRYADTFNAVDVNRLLVQLTGVNPGQRNRDQTGAAPQAAVTETPKAPLHR